MCGKRFFAMLAICGLMVGALAVRAADPPAQPIPNKVGQPPVLKLPAAKETPPAEATVPAAKATPPAAKATAPAAKAAAPAALSTAELIRRLGANDYFVRQQAQTELMKQGFKAFEALNEATSDDDLEIAARARYLLRMIRVEWSVESDPPEVKKLLQDYETSQFEERLAKMHNLANFSGPAGIAALARLARYEQSQILSKRAALEIIGQTRTAEPPSPKTAALLRRALEGSHRPAAGWLLCYARLSDDAPGAVRQWADICQAEQVVLRRTPADTEQQILVTLLRTQINWLEKLHRTDEAVATMRRLLDLEKDDPDTLSELVEWLIDQQAWKVIEETGARFSARFETQPFLLYALAAAQEGLGQKEKAEATAQRAHGLTPREVDRPNVIPYRLLLARQLWLRGLFHWAELEYRDVMAKTRPNDQQALKARFFLSEMLHDQGEELKAAEVLVEANKVLKDRSAEEEAAVRKVSEWRSRMHFFYACHYEGLHDRAKQRAALDDALLADPTDVDVLIGCFRLPDAPPEYRAKVRELIKKAAAALRNQITEAHGEDAAQPANQLAWLVGNTEGDFDEAIKFSKLSIELDPEAGGYYDTLGRCYYAKGDYENAVKFQSKAHEMEAHSGLIAKQLALFTKALEEQKKHKPPTAKADAKPTAKPVAARKAG